MNVQVGKIVITQDGEKHRIVSVDFSHQQGRPISYGTDHGGILPDQIDCVIGEECAKCKGPLIYNEGYYSFADGKNQCTTCGDRETVKV